MVVDREKASRLNILPQAIDDTLYDAFGQRQVSTIFTQLNQYRVILEAEPHFQLTPESLDKIYVKSTHGRHGAAERIRHASRSAPTPLTIVHQGQFPAVTLSFNLRPGSSLGQAVEAIQAAEKANRPARNGGHDLLRQRGGVSLLAEERAVSDPGGGGGDLHCAGRSLRELHSSDHDSLQLALGRSGRVAGADADGQ